ncbi:MAG: M42 family metallopeptidase [Peptococcaceae bacterium]|jgi:endoglucanase|nr:M42 family metallopeptidase [Peptococcaceae bacterium]
MSHHSEDIQYPLLQRLTQQFGPSGSENSVIQAILPEIQAFSDETKIDALGNLIAIKQGTSGKQIMISSHVDEIGIIVTYMDKNGFLRFTAIGGVHVSSMPYRRVRFQNGTVGTIGVEKLDKLSDLKLEKLYIDIGAASEEEAAVKVGIGDSAVFVGEYAEMGSRIMAKALDNRAGCFVLIEAMKRVRSPHTLAFAFTTQEEVGLRGARPAAYALEPDAAITVDVTRTGDTPKAQLMSVKLGDGVAIKVMDRSIVVSPAVKEWMIQTAKKRNIPYQYEVLESGGTESGMIQLTKTGVLTGVLSIPARYIHSPGEMIDQRDLETTIALLVALLQDSLEENPLF